MASLPFSEDNLKELENFIAFCKSNPKVVYTPQLSFFKSYIESLGGKFPEVDPECSKPEIPPEKESPEVPEPEMESEESDIEISDEGVIEPDPDESYPMADMEKEVSEDDMTNADEKKRLGVAAFSEQEFEKALSLYTEGILLNPGSALLYAKRGQCLLKLNKPNACIHDCNRALQINPDSAAAYKFRGRAHRLLGHWEAAAKDLRLACKIDFDEQADEWLREVTPKARKLEEHNRKYERKRAEKEMKEKRERARLAREEHKKASEKAAKEAQKNEMPGMGDFYNLLNDPELVSAFEDPEVAEAFKDVSENPMNIHNYMHNPKIAHFFIKMSKKFGFSGIPENFGSQGDPGSTKKPDVDDIGLD